MTVLPHVGGLSRDAFAVRTPTFVSLIGTNQIIEPRASLYPQHRATFQCVIDDDEMACRKLWLKTTERDQGFPRQIFQLSLGRETSICGSFCCSRPSHKSGRQKDFVIISIVPSMCLYRLNMCSVAKQGRKNYFHWSCFAMTLPAWTCHLNAVLER